MKVTKLRNGYTIRCNASEFEMLDRLIGATPPDAARRMLSGDVRSAHTRRLRKTAGDLLRMDVDRSKAPTRGAVENLIEHQG